MDHEAVLSLKGLRTDRRDAELAAVLEAQLPTAYRLASWILRDPGAAEDAVADAMLRAWERRATLRDEAAADAWFTRILTNVCRDQLRRRRRRSATIGWSPPPEAVDPGVQSSDRDEVGRGLEQLTPDERILLALRHGRDLSVFRRLNEIETRIDVRCLFLRGPSLVCGPSTIEPAASPSAGASIP